MLGRFVYISLAATWFASACTSNDGFRVAPFVEKPRMATAQDAGTVFDTDELPEIFGMRWRRTF
jgi:hypothetical protein